MKILKRTYFSGWTGIVHRLTLFTALLVGGLSLAYPNAAHGQVEVEKLVKDGLTSVPSGQTFTYLLRYRAASTTTDFFGATLEDVLPEGIQFQSLVSTVHVDSFNYDAASRLLTVNFIDPLPAGSTGEIEVNVRFAPGSTPSGFVAINTATMDADNSPPATSPPVTTTALASNRVTASKSLIGNSVPLDQNVSYQVRLNNSQTVGALNVSDVTLVDELPPGAVFVSASGGGVYDAGAHTVTWTVASLNAGSTLNRTLTLMFPSADFPVGASVTNLMTATATPLGQSPVNLSAQTVHSIVEPQAGSNFRKNVNQNYVYEGKEATKNWTFTLQNTGNVPLHDVVVTDTIPAELRVNAINVGFPNGTPPGLQSPVNVYYTKTGDATWYPAPGNPYPGSSSVTVPVSSLGLGAGEDVTAIRWEFGTLPVGYSVGNLRFASTILTTDRNGQPVMTGHVITNTAHLSYTDFEGPQTDTATATLPVRSPRPVAQLAKSASPGTVNDGDTTTFTLRLTNRSEAARPLENPILADLLDAKIEYVAGSWEIINKPADAPDPVFEVIDDYNSTGRTLLRWSWTGAAAYDLPIGSFIEMRFQARIPEFTLFGSIPNDLTLAQWGNENLDTAQVTATTDTFDLDGDGNTTETVYFRRANLTVRSRASMDSVKWVKGELDSDWSKYPDSGMTVPGGQADYRLFVYNTGNVPIRDAVVVDILPTLGDTGVIDLSQRDTEWIASLAGPVDAPPGVTVFYSREQDPLRTDFVPAGPAGAAPAKWSTTLPATLIEVRALKFVFDDIVIQPGESFELNWPMRAPVATPTDGRIAWNSFGYYGTRTDQGTTLLPSEPIKVGIAVEPDQNAAYGDRVWLDLNQNGIQDPGEPGLNGIKVHLYEDSGPGGLPDGIRDPSVDRYVGFTITADNFHGEPGYYLFPNLDRGYYYAVFEIPDGYVVTPAKQGDDPELDSDVISDDIWVDADGNRFGMTEIVWLPETVHDLSWDLGLWLPPTSVQIVKTAGTAGDGDVYWTLPGEQVTYTYVITNTGELPLVRIEVTDDILGFVGEIDGPLAPGDNATLTKVSGAMNAGVTNIGSVIARPADLDHGNEIPGAPPVTDEDPAVVKIYASIGDRVWYDTNANGIQDPGELGAPGVTVTLFDAVGDAITNMVTDANGKYLFTGLLPGEYSLGFELPTGYIFSPQNQGSDSAVDSDPDIETGRTVPVTLAAGQADMTWDAGIWLPAAIGDRVWVDTNRDGIQDPDEVGLAGVVVNLYTADGVLVDTTTTDADGIYGFNELLAGDYFVEFELPTGYAFSPQNEGTDPALDSDADPDTGRTAIVTLNPGDNDLTWDAGVWPLGAIGNFVWYDENENGLQDPGEPGVPGVTVRLWLDDTLVATTVTDDDGFYLFQGLLAGTYEVEFDLATIPPLYKPTIRGPVGPSTPLDSDADELTGRTGPIPLALGQEDLNWDMGIIPQRADLSLTKTLKPIAEYPAKWSIPLSKGEQFVYGDYWLRLEYDEPSFDVWGPGDLKSGVNVSRDWHHLVGRFTRGEHPWGSRTEELKHKMEILIDGVVVATKFNNGTPLPSDAPLVLGAYLGNSAWFAGLMDEVRLSRGLRSDAWLQATHA